MTDTMRILPCHEVPLEQVINLLQEIHAYYNGGATPPSAWVQAHLQDNLLSPSSPHRIAITVRDDGLAVGLVAITLAYSLVEFAPDQRKHCQLKELYVREADRGQGVGKALMAWVARQTLDHGGHRIDWPVRAGNDRGIAFYKSLGAEHLVERVSFRLSEPHVQFLAGMAST